MMNNSLLNPELTLSCQHWNLNVQKNLGFGLVSFTGLD